MTDVSGPHFDESRINSLPIGQVLEKQRGEYKVLYGTEEILCGLRSRLRKNLIYPISRQRRQSVDTIRTIQQVDPVAVGDFVRFSFVEETSSRGVIEHVEVRKNQLSRKAPGSHPLEDVICANIDALILVFSVSKPKAKVGMIDRMMVAAEWEFIPIVLVLNKTDLDRKGKELDLIREIYLPSGYKIIATSAETGEGVDELRALMVGKISVLAGPSGVGKTSLLNVIQPGLGLRVREISESTGKGTHTTSHLQAFPLDFGGLVMDTPGLKQLALWDLVPEELETLYPEMEPLSGKCKFGASCMHETEPGCVIKKAVEEGKIHIERYKSYLRLRKNLDDLYGDPYK